MIVGFRGQSEKYVSAKELLQVAEQRSELIEYTSMKVVLCTLISKLIRVDRLCHMNHNAIFGKLSSDSESESFSVDVGKNDNNNQDNICSYIS